MRYKLSYNCGNIELLIEDTNMLAVSTAISNATIHATAAMLIMQGKQAHLQGGDTLEIHIDHLTTSEMICLHSMGFTIEDTLQPFKFYQRTGKHL